MTAPSSVPVTECAFCRGAEICAFCGGQSSVPAQGEAMEVLRELVEVITDEPRPFAARRTQWFKHLNAILDRARALVAASPCAANAPMVVAWRDHVEQRLLTWRQRFVNRSGDQLALDDFMDRASLDDLIDYVCDEYARPSDAAPIEAVDAAAAHGGQQPAGWAHNEDPDRVISAAQKRQAEKDGGASASSVRAYTVALYAAPAPAAPLTEEQIHAIADIGSAPLNRDGMLYRFARDVEWACAAKWGITLAGTAGTKKESE